MVVFMLLNAVEEPYMSLDQRCVSLSINLWDAFVVV